MLEDVKPHLVELRKRIFISVLALFAGFIISFIFYKPILDWVTKPLENALAMAKTTVQKSEDGQWKLEGKDINKSLMSKIVKVESNVSIATKAIENAEKILQDINSTKTEKLLASSLKDLATYAISLKKQMGGKQDSSAVFGEALQPIN